MRRLLATFALAPLAGTAVAATVENIIVRNGEHSYVNGDADYDRTLGGRYASFELDGVRYVITDEETLDKIDEIIQPQVELGRKQAELGARQAKLGAEQAKLGAKQAELGAKQRWARDEDEGRELAAQQRELSEKQRELGARQGELGERQRDLGELQRAAGKKAEKEMENVFKAAVRSGIARRR